MSQMRAIVHRSYGTPDVLRIEDVTMPAPQSDEVLVQVYATTVNRTDCGFRQGKPAIVRAFAGLRRPRKPILGTEFAGVVTAIGAEVTEYAVGDRVFGVNSDRFGAHAEYMVVRQKAPMATMPDGIGYAEAAAVCDGYILAKTCWTWAGLDADQRVLVFGASGSIGTAGVQLAKAAGAHVTAVCSTKDLEVVGSLGADVVIDYTRDDFTAGNTSYHIIFDAVGKSSFGHCRGSLVRGGVYVGTDFGPRFSTPIMSLLTWLPARFGARQAMMPLPLYRKQDVLEVKQLMEQRRYRAVIDRRYSLDEIAQATRYVETEQKTGNVVINVVAEA